MREGHHSPVILGVDADEYTGEQVVADVEKTMIEKFIEVVERALARNVLAFISNHRVGPDLETSYFLLTPDRTSDERAPVVAEPDAV